jgi:hypothetical protein
MSVVIVPINPLIPDVMMTAVVRRISSFLTTTILTHIVLNPCAMHVPRGHVLILVLNTNLATAPPSGVLL